nr:hypothetical protein [Clostridia bacterium]
MRIKPPSLYIIYVSTVFVFILILTAGSLHHSTAHELEAIYNERALLPRMAVSLADPCASVTVNTPEVNIIPSDEWFPVPPEVSDDPDTADEDDVPPKPVTENPLGPGYYDFASPVPLADPVGDDYFLNTLFIGDSRTVGVGAWGGVKAYFYAKVALTIRGVMSIPFIEDTLAEEPVTRTIMDTIREYPVFDNVYIAFGLNELGWSKNAFITTYEEVVKQIRALLPDADIYVQAVIPVSKATSDKGNNGVTNEGVREYNRQLQDLCERMGLFYLAVDEELCDENGDMPAESVAADGIHFGGAVCRQIMEYVRNHVVVKEDYIWE